MTSTDVATAPEATLSIDRRGLVTLEIADSKGEVWSYQLDHAVPGRGEAWAVWLTRLDTGELRRVSLRKDGKWACNCPDSIYRGKQRRHGCKHQKSVRPLKQLMDTLSGAVG